MAAVRLYVLMDRSMFWTDMSRQREVCILYIHKSIDIVQVQKVHDHPP